MSSIYNLSIQLKLILIPIFMPPLSPQGEAQYYNNRFDVGWFVYSTESDRFLLVDKENTLGAVFAGWCNDLLYPRGRCD